MFTLTSQSLGEITNMHILFQKASKTYIKIEDQYLNLNIAKLQYFCNFVNFDLLCCLSNTLSLSGIRNLWLS